jgi:hypothetical protein
VVPENIKELGAVKNNIWGTGWKWGKS